MSVSTEGLQLRTGSRWVSDMVELLSSMRFAISLLTVICIASVIGTVVKQHEPFNNYVNQFGPFWADVFASANLFSVSTVMPRRPLTISLMRRGGTPMALAKAY